MASISKKDRAVGAIMGTLIGDALGLGPHWYYDLNEQKKDYGDWITDYMPPKTDRYHHGLEAGDVSQTGEVAIFLLESAASDNGYNQDDFTSRVDRLLDTLDGTSSGGRFTDQAMRDVWRQRREENRPWDKCGSLADTGEAAIRASILAAAFRSDFKQAREHLIPNVQLTHRDPFIAGLSIGFGLIVWAMINGVPLAGTTNHIQHKAAKAEVKLALTVEWMGREESVPFYGGVLLPRWMAEAAKQIKLEPPVLLPLLTGMGCPLDSMLTGAYYYAARYEGDFEKAVLMAINSGGNNMARASLTGALVGAGVGIQGIPERFVTGLKDHERLIALAEKVAGTA